MIDKYLLRERPDVKNGYLKSTPIEVLAFPDYTPPKGNKSEGIFRPNSINENQHRTYEKGTYINLPSALIDSGILKNLRRQDPIKDVYNKNKTFKDEYLKDEILPRIPIDQIKDYNNYKSRVDSDN